MALFLSLLKIKSIYKSIKSIYKSIYFQSVILITLTQGILWEFTASSSGNIYLCMDDQLLTANRSAGITCNLLLKYTVNKEICQYVAKAT